MLFSWMAVWNLYPLIYEDTQGYLQRPATAAAALTGVRSEWADPSKVARVAVAAPGTTPGTKAGFKGGRSIYYGTAAWLFDCIGGLWAVAAAQCLSVGIVISLLYYRGLGLTSHLGFAVVAAVLAAGSAATLFANLIMPDVFAGVLIAALAALLTCWPRLRRADRIVLVLVAAFAVTAHDTHLLLAGAMLVAALLLRLLPSLRATLGWSGIRATAGVVTLGVVAIFGFALAVRAVTGQPPERMPFMTAHLAGKPVLAEFLTTHCDDTPPQWAVCRFRSRLPIHWIAFLFDPRPASGSFQTADPALKQAIARQDMALMLAVLAAEPVQTSAMLAGDAALQLVSFSYADLSPRGKVGFIDRRFPPHVVARIHASRLWHDDRPLEIWSTIQQAGVVLSIPVIVAGLVLMARRRDAMARVLMPLVLLLIAGVGANAIVCGVLASPYDRFQARVVWLLPLAALLITAWLSSSRRPALSRS